MKKGKDNNRIPAELIAAYLDGNTTEAESRRILDALEHDKELRELMSIALSVEEPEETKKPTKRRMETLPITALAAYCRCDNMTSDVRHSISETDEFSEYQYRNNRCCIECEKFVLRRRNIAANTHQLVMNAEENGWLKDGGTPLHNIGRNLEQFGLVVRRQYKCTVDDIVSALDAEEDVIAVVDCGELTGDTALETREDFLIGEIPDHTVVVLACDTKEKTITIYDPASPNAQDTYQLDIFEDAWADSKKYLVTISNKENMKTYTPKPIDLSDVELTDDLNELREAIAENAHEIWAQNRQAEGWTYGPQRNDQLKQTPDMVPYSQLPESEKLYDREMAMKTIKLLKKLGYDLIKRENTELYHVLRQRIMHSHSDYHCRRCGNVIYKHQIFCDKCGLELNMDWKEK